MKSEIDRIVRSTREILLPHYGNVGVLRNKTKSPADGVTELDIKIEEFLAHELRTLDPTIQFVGEENGGNRDAKKFWLVDPIDGTGHFIRGLPFCTTQLALIQDSEVMLSAIYDFIHDKLYFAEKNKGAFCNDDRIHVSDRSLKNAYVAWETHLDKEENLKLFAELNRRCVLSNTISSGYEHAMVASGKLEGRICFDPHGFDFDFAPGALLVKEAGGIVTNFGKNTYDYRNCNFIAANPRVYKELIESIDWKNYSIIPLL